MKEVTPALFKRRERPPVALAERVGGSSLPGFHCVEWAEPKRSGVRGTAATVLAD